MQASAVSKATQHGMGTPYLWQLACICINCPCIGYAINRGKIRDTYNINGGGGCGDICIHCWCGPCAACQEYREVKSRQT